MESQPRAAMIYGASRYWHSWSGNPDDPGRDFVPDPGVPTKGLLEPPVLIKQLYPFGPATTPRPSNFLVRRDALEDIGGFEEHFRGVYQLYDDQAFLVKLYLHGAIFVSSEEWDKYRIHPGSCDAAAVRGGHYDSIRGFFLKWFETYLRRQDISNPEIWSLLRSSVAAARVQLRTDGGSTARLAGSLDDPEGVQIAIEKAATGAAPDIQLNLPYYELQAGRRYALHFRGRADRPRNLGVGVAAAHAPWAGLGLYRQIELTAEWRRFEVEFAAAADEDNARIYFDAGESDPSVELTAVSLRQMPEGQPIEPSLALVQTS